MQRFLVLFCASVLFIVEASSSVLFIIEASSSVFEEELSLFESTFFVKGTERFTEEYSRFFALLDPRLHGPRASPLHWSFISLYTSSLL